MWGRGGEGPEGAWACTWALNIHACGPRHPTLDACTLNCPIHSQGIASAPLWDSDKHTINGVISASDFINILKRLRHSVSAGGNPMSEVEMDAHTIRWVGRAGDGRGGEGRESGWAWGWGSLCASDRPTKQPTDQPTTSINGRGLREEVALEGREPKQLVYVRPDDDLGKVVGTLFSNKCSMAPVLSAEPGGREVGPSWGVGAPG